MPTLTISLGNDEREMQRAYVVHYHPEPFQILSCNPRPEDVLMHMGAFQDLNIQYEMDRIEDAILEVMP